jgi:hypothetical protein
VGVIGERYEEMKIRQVVGVRDHNRAENDRREEQSHNDELG